MRLEIRNLACGYSKDKPVIKNVNMTLENGDTCALLGPNGVGKTTLACSAPKPLLIDFDRGISRVRADHRVTTSMADTYEEVWSDMQSPEIAQFETIVIDTGGSFVTFLKDWAFRTKPQAKTKSGEFNSLKGFGFVKTEFQNFTNYIKTVLNKNIIYVFHTDEKADKDGNPIQRLVCEGAARNTVWNSCDFGGYVQMIGNQRMICFTPEQEYFAKGTHGITGRIPVPFLDKNIPNNFMTRLFEQARKNIEAEKEYFEPLKQQYESTMENVKGIIADITDAGTANIAASTIGGLDHALTSKQEALAMLKAKTDALGLKYTKKDGYVLKGE